MDLVLIALGGAAGAASRYLVDRLAANAFGILGLGTLIVNVSGSFLLGILAAVVMERQLMPAELRPLLGIGFLGAYTTFSTFTLEAWAMAELGYIGAALAYLVGSVVLGMLAVVAGLTIGRVIA